MSNPPDDERTILATGPIATGRTPLPDHGGNAFAVGARLGEFEITRVLGEGGFGIVYLAWDSSLERQVALKEYMPSSFAARSATMQVSVKSERDVDTFQAGLKSFVNEARILARFDHPSLLKVYRFWEANGTAYMVMPYYQGETLKQTLLARSERPDEAWLKALLAPLLDTLALIHAHQCFHRDIAPDNIMMLESGRPLLLDFGAARQAISGMQQQFTVIFKQNYAPIEQYAEMPGMSQGPWTDLYALASVVHFAMTGTAPPPAVSRLVQDPYVPLAERFAGRFSDRFLQAIDQALAVKPEDRPQSAEAMRALLGLTAEVRPHVPASSPAQAAAPAVFAEPVRRSRGPALLIGGVVLLAVAGGAAFMLRGTPAPVVAVTAPAPAVVAAPPPPPKPYDPLVAVQEVAAGASPDRAVIATTDKSRLRIDKDKITFSVQASHDGYLYVQMVGSNRTDYYMLFPNDVDHNNFVKAGQTITLPTKGWSMPAGGPAGVDQIIAIVSDAPRSFAGLVHGDTFSTFPVADVQKLHRLYTGATPLFAGTPDCAAGAPCSPLYGASKFSIQEY